MRETLPFEELEPELVARAIDGDEHAFTQLFDRHYPRIFRHVYYRIGVRQDAEDLTQQVFLNAWRAIGRYRPTDVPFVAWLFTIAHHATVNFYRRQKPTAPLDPEVEAWPDDYHLEGETEVHLEHERVRAAMRTLRPDHQQVLAMRFLEDLPCKDIAAAMGKTEVNVRVLQHRALHELRRQLEHSDQ